MRAVIQGGVRDVRVADLAEPHSEGAARIRTRAVGICGSDLHLYRTRAEPQSRPGGHEVAGEVIELPSGYRGPLEVGDVVAVDAICLGIACGVCEDCLVGAPVHCRQQAGSFQNGGFAEVFECKPEGLFKLPAGVSAEAGALVEPLAVAVHAVRRAEMPAGASVAVLGAGTIGLTTIIAARALGAGRIDVLARHDHQAALATTCGATAVHREPPASLDADYVFETVGGTAAGLEQAWSLARPMGRVVVMGVILDKHPTDLLTPLARELTVIFSNCYGTRDGRHDFEVAIDLLARGVVPTERIVTHRFDIERTPEAFRTADDKAFGSVKV
ncbi:MAG: alcohol dehydrogenase catalytic domain-containing protein, partial [Chloroflexi bacterium]|nr:alcohol dehydrogenase catalytic domain-containing protein [Chloroflexota bacterium]